MSIPDPPGHAPSPAVARDEGACAKLVAATYEAAEAKTGRDAGATLAAGGWCVFPTPAAHDRLRCRTCATKRDDCDGKFDQGPAALSYRSASTSVELWVAQAVEVMRRHRVADVGVATSPWRCSVPLVALDLDGQAAVDAFPALNSRSFRVESGRPDGGRHVYLSGSPTPLSGLHRFGGEIRGDRGHLMLPGSTVAERRDYYRPSGERIPDVSDPAMDGVLDGVRETRGGAGATGLSESEGTELLLAWSTRPGSGWALEKFEFRLEELREAAPGWRHPAMASAVSCAVACAAKGGLSLRWALRRVADTFAETVWAEPNRDPDAEVWSMALWAMAQQKARPDEDWVVEVDEELVEWARQATAGGWERVE